jgi:lysophospholipase L1-like esterase
MKGRMRTSLLACLVATGCAASPEAEVQTDDSAAYLALGDSVAFGYDPLVADKTAVVGYPELLAQRLGLTVTNASCPGEATGGFISSTGNDNNCRENRQEYPLHIGYDGTQLAFAIEFLREHPNTQLVTIDIGGNDASKLNDTCAGDTGCVLGGFLNMLMEYGNNLDTIFGELRKVYDGPLVALAIYNPFPEDTIAQYGLERLNWFLAERAKAFDVTIADGMAAFADASGGDPCASGLLIGMPDGTCDIHPSSEGDEILADAIEAVMPR